MVQCESENGSGSASRDVYTCCIDPEQGKNALQQYDCNVEAKALQKLRKRLDCGAVVPGKLYKKPKPCGNIRPGECEALD